MRSARRRARLERWYRAFEVVGEAPERALHRQQLALGAALGDAAVLDDEDLVGAPDGRSRWAMISDVRPRSSRSSARSIRSSVGRSMFDVASSRIRMRGSASSARAIEISWRSPADRPAPPSRTTCSRPAVEARGDPVDADRRAPSPRPPRRSPRAGRSGCCRRSCRRRGTDPGARRRAGGGSSQLDLAQVEAVDAHGAVVRVVEAGDQLRERRLAAARLAHEREAAARPARGLDPVQHRLLAVRERDAVDVDVALDARQRHGAGRVLDLGLGVEDGAIFTIAAPADCTCPYSVRELLQRLEDELEQEDAARERADLASPASTWAPTHSTATVATTPRNSIAGKKTEKMLLRVDVRAPVRGVQLVELAPGTRARG